MKKTLASLVTVCLVLVLGVSSVSAFTPPGLAKKDGLPPGIQKKFIQEEKDIKEYETTIKAIDVKERRIFIEDGTAILSLLVSDKAEIELNEKIVNFKVLRENDKVVIKLDKDNTIIELKATREKEAIETEKLEGKILAKYDGKDPLIIIQIDNDIKVYYVAEDVDISKIKAGNKAVIYVRNNEIISIKIK